MTGSFFAEGDEVGVVWACVAMAGRIRGTRQIDTMPMRMGVEAPIEDAIFFILWVAGR
jgi:hypothetical protein